LHCMGDGSEAGGRPTSFRPAGDGPSPRRCRRDVRGPKLARRRRPEVSGAMDWESWARGFESTKGPDAFAALFAEGGRFCDPVTSWTTDVRKVATDTDAIFPDWSQRVDRIRGGDDWAVFEWTGTATFTAGG